MSFDIALRNHLLRNAEITALVDDKVYQTLYIDDKTSRSSRLPAIVFELEKEERPKLNQVHSIYSFVSISLTLSEANDLEQILYEEFKSWNGKLNDTFPCRLQFLEMKRQYNKEFDYWMVQSRYSVSYLKQ